MKKRYLIWIWRIGLIVGASLLACDLLHYLSTGEEIPDAIFRYGSPIAVLISCAALYWSRRVDEEPQTPSRGSLP